MTVDVVIPSLMRRSLFEAMLAVQHDVGEVTFIVVHARGLVGHLRNEGLRRVKSEFVGFVDDDVIVPKGWFSRCIRVLTMNTNLICVSGKIPLQEGLSLGCLVCRTEKLREIGGFPDVDSFLPSVACTRLLLDVSCEHRLKGFDAVSHTFLFLVHGIGSQQPMGIYVNPVESVRLFCRFLKLKRPDYSLAYILWFIKSLYVFAMSRLRGVHF